jgi:glycosyltransferase involved in cell wall biosynthesis
VSLDASAELVSVVVATHNMGRYLSEAVHSALSQGYPSLEVQIVDDGSTDDTPQVLEQWRDDPRVRVHRQANAGQTRAKNQGIALSRGAFIAFLDADDVWLPGKLEQQMALFRSRPDVGVVYSDFERMDGEGKTLPKGEVPPMHRGRITGPLLITNFVSFSSSVVRRECFTACGPFDESIDMGIDYELWLRLSAHYAFDFVPAATVRYRVWSGSMSKNYRKRYQSAIRIMAGFLERNPHIVAASVVREGWAHTYVGRGNSILWREHDHRAAFADYARALGYVPWYWPAWRAILRGLITTQTPR